jgi:hypothetical protein
MADILNTHGNDNKRIAALHPHMLCYMTYGHDNGYYVTVATIREQFNNSGEQITQPLWQIRLADLAMAQALTGYLSTLLQ